MIAEIFFLTEIPHAIRMRNFRDHGIFGRVTAGRFRWCDIRESFVLWWAQFTADFL